MGDDDIAIKVDHVSKIFKLPHEKNTSVKNAVVNFWRREKGYEMLKALEDISFEVKKGEFFGIVGRNGSGKSTMLKLLAGIYTPSKGSVQVNGKLTPFIELGVGFNQDLTGRENVFLNGALLGFSRKEMEAMYDDIVSFAELERFMDQKLRNYSSGMQVRLAFSIAIRANGDILLLDEVLAVGDEAFQKKCFEYFAELKRGKKTVILVSHDMESVKRYCDRAILLKNGNLVDEGNTNKVAEKYIELNVQALHDEKNQKEEAVNKKPAAFNYPLTITARTLKAIDGKKKKTAVFNQQETIIIEAEIVLKEKNREVENAEVGISIIDETGKTIFIESSTRKSMKGVNLNQKQDRVKVTFSVYNVFGEGKYSLSVAVLDLLKRTTYGRADGENTIHVISKEKAGWLLKPPSDINYLS